MEYFYRIRRIVTENADLIKDLGPFPASIIALILVLFAGTVGIFLGTAILIWIIVWLVRLDGDHGNYDNEE